MEYGDSSPLSSAPRSAPTVEGPPRLAPTPFVVPPSGGLSFPAEAGTPAGSSHLEQATGRPRRSTLQFDSVGRVHNPEVGTHRCGHKSAGQSRRDVAKQAQGGADARNERGATLGYESNAKQKPEGLALTLAVPTSNRELPCSTSSITITSTKVALLLVLSFRGARTRNRRSCAAETPSLPAHLCRSAPIRVPGDLERKGTLIFAHLHSSEMESVLFLLGNKGNDPSASSVDCCSISALLFVCFVSFVVPVWNVSQLGASSDNSRSR